MSQVTAMWPGSRILPAMCSVTVCRGNESSGFTRRDCKGLLWWALKGKSLPEEIPFLLKVSWETYCRSWGIKTGFKCEGSNCLRLRESNKAGDTEKPKNSSDFQKKEKRFFREKRLKFRGVMFLDYYCTVFNLRWSRSSKEEFWKGENVIWINLCWVKACHQLVWRIARLQCLV